MTSTNSGKQSTALVKTGAVEKKDLMLVGGVAAVPATFHAIAAWWAQWRTARYS